MKTKKILSCAFAALLMLAMVSCNGNGAGAAVNTGIGNDDNQGENNPPQMTSFIWECILEPYAHGDDTIGITLTIDSITNLVNVSKSPKEYVPGDNFHLFRDGQQYFLRSDTLHQIDGEELKTLDDIGYCKHFYDFIITKLSENEIKLEYLGATWAIANLKTSYIFNKWRM